MKPVPLPTYSVRLYLLLYLREADHFVQLTRDLSLPFVPSPGLALSLHEKEFDGPPFSDSYEITAVEWAAAAGRFEAGLKPIEDRDQLDALEFLEYLVAEEGWASDMTVAAAREYVSAAAARKLGRPGA